jgi:hypothetical protein
MKTDRGHFGILGRGFIKVHMLVLPVRELILIAASGFVLAATGKAWTSKKLKAVRISRGR